MQAMNFQIYTMYVNRKDLLVQAIDSLGDYARQAVVWEERGVGLLVWHGWPWGWSGLYLGPPPPAPRPGVVAGGGGPAPLLSWQEEGGVSFETSPVPVS